MIEEELLQRYERVVPINRKPLEWNTQNLTGRYDYPKTELTREHICGMLQHKYWLGTRALCDGSMDRIALDLDCDHAGHLNARTDLYWQIRRVFGAHRIPLVYQTPSGFGLRVVYRIPSIARSHLITDGKNGLIADVLRGAGMDLRDGILEIYPQPSRADRLMLGRRMPLLDPGTLLPLAHAAIGDGFDLVILRQALEEIEAWYAHPYADLVDHLQTLEKHSPANAASLETELPSGASDPGEAFKPSTACSILIAQGLTRPNSRYEAEKQVGLAFIRNPEFFEEYGLCAGPSREDVARALAYWLSLRHNGLSDEWRESVSKHGSVARAVEWWTKRYLAPNSLTAGCFVDRLTKIVRQIKPGFGYVRQLSADERGQLLTTAERNFPAGALRYRFECWLFTWLRAVKEVIHHHHTRIRRPLEYRATTEGYSQVKVELSAKWMEKWPYGSGQDTTTRQTRYAQFREILVAEGLMEWATPYVNYRYSYGAPFDCPGQATGYWVACPDMQTTVSDVPVAPGVMSRAIEGVCGFHTRPLTVDEAYHALDVTGRGYNLSARYSRYLARRIGELVVAIRARLPPGGGHT